MKIPKTPRGLTNKIERLRANLTYEKRKYKFIDDGSGSRYYIFYLCFLLNDKRTSMNYIRWYEKQFPDDMGEPFQLLCWALILYRAGKDGTYQLGRTMIQNVYLIPHILGEGIERYDMWHPSNYAEPGFAEYIPERILEAITDDDLEWLRGKYHSEEFQGILKRHIEIMKELPRLPVGEARSGILQEDMTLAEQLI